MSNISAYVSPHSRMAISSAAAIEVASAAHPMKRTTVDAGKAAPAKSAAPKSSTPSSIGIGKKGCKADEGGEKKYQTKFENCLHDTRLPNSWPDSSFALESI
jgi:hypothetical protein